MAGDGKNLLWIEHSTLPAQHIFHLTVVQARDPTGHDQQRLIADPETNRLSVLRGFDTVQLRRKLNSRRAVVSLDEFDVRRVRLKEGANRFKTHWLFRRNSTGFARSNRASPGLGCSRLMWEAAIRSLSPIGSGVEEAAVTNAHRQLGCLPVRVMAVAAIQDRFNAQRSEPTPNSN